MLTETVAPGNPAAALEEIPLLKERGDLLPCTKAAGQVSEVPQSQTPVLSP